MDDEFKIDIKNYKELISQDIANELAIHSMRINSFELKYGKTATDKVKIYYKDINDLNRQIAELSESSESIGKECLKIIKNLNKGE